MSIFFGFVLLTKTPKTFFPNSSASFIVFNASVTAEISGFVIIKISSPDFKAARASLPRPAAASIITKSESPCRSCIMYSSFSGSTFFIAFNEIEEGTTRMPEG